MCVEFRTVKNTWSAKVTFYTVLLQIHSGNCVFAKNDIAY